MGVTPRNSFSQETTTQDNGRLPQRKMGTPGLASLAPLLASPPPLNRPLEAVAVVAKAVPSPKAVVGPRPGGFPAEASLPAASAPAAVFPSVSSVVTRLAVTLTTTMTSLAAA